LPRLPNEPRQVHGSWEVSKQFVQPRGGAQYLSPEDGGAVAFDRTIVLDALQVLLHCGLSRSGPEKIQHHQEADNQKQNE
jgi:hypothetical protein